MQAALASFFQSRSFPFDSDAVCDALNDTLISICRRYGNAVLFVRSPSQVYPLSRWNATNIPVSHQHNQDSASNETCGTRWGRLIMPMYSIMCSKLALDKSTRTKSFKGR